MPCRPDRQDPAVEAAENPLVLSPVDLWLGCCLPWLSYVVVFVCAVNSRVSELEDFFSAVTDAVFDRILRIDVSNMHSCIQYTKMCAIECSTIGI